MSNIASDLNSLVNNLTTNFNSISSGFNSLQTNATETKFVKKVGDTMSGSLNMNSNKITNLANATNPNDAVNLSQVNSLISSGGGGSGSFNGSLSTNLNMNSNKITNVANGTLSTDAVNLSQLPTKLSDLTTANTTDISLNNFKLTNVTNPTTNQDAATKNYVDNFIISNTNITDGTISATKLTNYPNDGTKYLSGDGTFKVVSGGSGGSIDKTNIENALTGNIGNFSLGSGSYDITLTINNSNFFNTAFGTYAFGNTNDTPPTNCFNNSAFGYSALQNNNECSDSIGIGYGAHSECSNVTSNTCIGNSSCVAITGSECSAIGVLSLNNNTGNYCSAIGVQAGITNTYNKCTFIGHIPRVATANNQILLGSTTETVIATSYSSVSDQRDKTEIRDTVLGLDFINKIKPVDYKWNHRDDYIERKIITKKRTNPTTGLEEEYKDVEIIEHDNDESKKGNRFHHGVIAQDIQQIIQDTGVDFGGFQNHNYNGNGGDKLSISYLEFIGPLIKSVQELSQQNKSLQDRIKILEDKLNN